MFIDQSVIAPANVLSLNVFEINTEKINIINISYCHELVIFMNILLKKMDGLQLKIQFYMIISISFVLIVMI